MQCLLVRPRLVEVDLFFVQETGDRLRLHGIDGVCEIDSPPIRPEIAVRLRDTDEVVLFKHSADSGGIAAIHFVDADEERSINILFDSKPSQQNVLRRTCAPILVKDNERIEWAGVAAVPESTDVACGLMPSRRNRSAMAPRGPSATGSSTCHECSIVSPWAIRMPITQNSASLS